MDCVDPVVAGLELKEGTFMKMEEQLGDSEKMEQSSNTCQFDGWQPKREEEPWYVGKYVEPMW